MRFCGRRRIWQKNKRLLKLCSSLKVASRLPLREYLLIVPAAWTAISDLPLEKTVRAVRIVDSKCFDQRNHIHDQFRGVWNGLVRVDFEQHSVTINKDLPGQSLRLFVLVTSTNPKKTMVQISTRPSSA